MNSRSAKILLAITGLLLVAFQHGCARESTLQVASGRERADFVRDHLRATSVSFTYQRSEADSRTGVRDFTVTFQGSLNPREPIARYPDGTPVEEVLLLTPDAMRTVVDHLESVGVFQAARRWHSAWRSDTVVSPPADSHPFTPDLFALAPAGGVVVRVTTSADGWHHNFSLTYPHDSASRQMLIDLSARLSDVERRAIEHGLLGKMR
jgi:hypothetical protein